CDKTTPALLLGATSMNIPAIYLPAGPMLRGNWKGKTLGSGSDGWKYWDERRAGKISDKDWLDIEAADAVIEGDRQQQQRHELPVADGVKGERGQRQPDHRGEIAAPPEPEIAGQHDGQEQQDERVG
ncbi:dihydroxy-acid dehydratase, partial [Bradyrhizobium ottawaense]|uniref:dihydroxy-acid dehydratase domain-containing protein n=1 Tax=Bradyrhizobium ottawaense TaxID=931866 RepID=UPI0030C6F283